MTGDIVTAKRLAKFLGVSTRTLRRMDEDGRLRALRRPSGQRYYTSIHILKAIELRGGNAKNIQIKFCKNGATSIYGKVSIPRGWLEAIGITPDSPDAVIDYDGEKITISAPVREE